MQLVLATNHLGLGGSESYLFTVAEQFDRLGHEVVVYSPEPAAGAPVAAERGLTVVGEEGLPEQCDAVVAQDGAVSLELAGLLPRTPQIFVAHSESYDLQAPPQLDGVLAAVVALNDRVAARMRSFAVPVEVVRLRQPIDTERFTPRGSLPPVAETALVFGNNPNADRQGLLEAACREAGLELSRLGGPGAQTTDPRPALARADIVIGYGRAILEAMACGRAAYVYDWHGGEGWVTADSYTPIEADGIAGRSGRRVLDTGSLAADLAGYNAAMGAVNHDLVISHHRANAHAQELLALIERIGPVPERPRTALAEMARLVRLEWRARSDVQGLAQDNVQLRELLGATEVRLVEATAATEEAVVRAGEEKQAAIEMYEQSITWRLGAPLRALGRLMRRVRGRSG